MRTGLSFSVNGACVGLSLGHCSGGLPEGTSTTNSSKLLGLTASLLAGSVVDCYFHHSFLSFAKLSQDQNSALLAGLLVNINFT